MDTEMTSTRTELVAASVAAVTARASRNSNGLGRRRTSGSNKGSRGPRGRRPAPAEPQVELRCRSHYAAKVDGEHRDRCNRSDFPQRDDAPTAFGTRRGHQLLQELTARCDFC